MEEALGWIPLQIAVGKGANIVALRSVPGAIEDQTLDHWIITNGRDSVAAVWCHGRQMVSEG